MLTAMKQPLAWLKISILNSASLSLLALPYNFDRIAGKADRDLCMVNGCE